MATRRLAVAFGWLSCIGFSAFFGTLWSLARADIPRRCQPIPAKLPRPWSRPTRMPRS